ncbi:MAG: hypothetical protein JWO96_326 [Candidatus Saccharibacteria bacterium]|nr:hypothetical protein [Candidatus Saccharibacteria bacterium]
MVEPAPVHESAEKDPGLTSEDLTFKQWSLRKVGGANPERPKKADLDDIESLPAYIDKFEAVAEYALRLSGHLKSGREIGAKLRELNEFSAARLDGRNRARIGRALERVIEDDRAREIILEILPNAAVIADAYRSPELSAQRQALLEATRELDDMPAIKRVEIMFRSNMIGQVTRRGASDTLRILGAEIEGIDLPIPPSHLHGVE